MFTTEIAEAIIQQSKRFASQKGVTKFLYRRITSFHQNECGHGNIKTSSSPWLLGNIQGASTAWFPTIMRRDRFFTILRFLYWLILQSKRKKVNRAKTHYIK